SRAPLTSQVRIVSSLLPEATVRLSDVKATHETSASWPAATGCSLSDSAVQRPSAFELATPRIFESGENASEVAFRCREARSLPVALSQTLSVPSWLQDATSLPSGETATRSTKSLCPS